MKTFESTNRREVMDYLSNLLNVSHEDIENIQKQYSTANNKDEDIETNRYDSSKKRIYRVDELLIEGLVVNRAFQKIKGFSRSESKEFFNKLV